MRLTLDSNTGFTLVEMLIVVLIIGIIAMVIIPQVSNTSSDAKQAVLCSTLNEMRARIQHYHLEHDNTYPGEVNASGSPVLNADDAAAAFFLQLTRFTNERGLVSTVKTPAHKYGPYLNQQTLPRNPFNRRTDVLCDITTEDITARAADGTTAWKFYTKTGVFIANDGAHEHL